MSSAVTTSTVLGLGIDAGGTQTRWALSDASGIVLASGDVNAMTALQMGSEQGQQHVRATVRAIAHALPPGLHPANVCAGITGHTEGGDSLRTLIATAFAIDKSAVSLRSDIEITYLDLYGPGEGYVIYAGTGTIAAFIDESGTFHRAGGRGALLDDAGGGYWIAIEALRQIWRAEDSRPGSWRESPLATEMFNRLGGDDWARTRQFIYQRERGEIGTLALAVASAADRDPSALAILERAGAELARLGNVLIDRFGDRPIALAGRASILHPAIETALRKSLAPHHELKVRTSEAHIAAAHIAAKSIVIRSLL